jgi:hypothetical protein
MPTCPAARAGCWRAATIYKNKEADRLVTRIDPEVVSLVAELRRRHREQRHNRIDWGDWFYSQ